MSIFHVDKLLNVAENRFMINSAVNEIIFFSKSSDPAKKTNDSCKE